MALQDFINSAGALRLGLVVGGSVPPRLGYAMANMITGILGRRRRSTMMRTMHDNFRVVLGATASEEQIGSVARAALRNAGRCNYDLYHTLAKGKQAALDAVTFSPRVESYLAGYKDTDRGHLIVSAHISNFDMAGLAFATRDVPLQVLTWPSPTSGYDMQNEIRRSWGLDITPVSVPALRQALRRLRAGGLVITGVDRPDPGGAGEALMFFGRPAYLPTGHVRLALQAQVPITVVVVRHDANCLHTYVVDVETTLELEQKGDRQEMILHNAQRVLAVLETAIRRHPEQWTMFYPVWNTEMVQAPQDRGVGYE
ncbi:MAG: lysophospholipid acyltransferase family protein [Chloroflexi bacterium]|nr:lysophospholipid acyltransferase family protein [Chloroflexota bacterium]